MSSPDPRQAPERLMAGAVDLSSLAQSRPSPPPQAPAAGDEEAPNPPAGGAVVVDVSEATFQSEVLERSLSAPVVVDFWAEWCGPCKQLSPVLEKLAIEGEGSWTLAKVDVEANQQLAAAFQIQGIPMVLAFVGGRPVDGFQGVQPEETLRSWLGQLIQAAGGQAPETPEDPRMTAADAALEKGDFAAAEKEFEAFLAENPADPGAEAGLSQVRLLRRLDSADVEAAAAALSADPNDVEAALTVADAEVASGRADQAYERLIQLVGRNSGEVREQLRTRLVDLFSVADPEDPTVAQARRKLAAVLF